MKYNKDINNDNNPLETREWIDSLKSVIKFEGKDRALFLLETLFDTQSIQLQKGNFNTPYKNTINSEDEHPLPHSYDVLKNSTALIRWNAIVMVLRAGKKFPELGGHIASYASSAVLYEIGFNYFFRSPSQEHLGDLVLFQGHSSPGIYARSFLQDIFTEENLDNFRQESGINIGLSSYPHPWCMPTYWQFPTVSMGLGPIQAVYQARFLHYLNNRKILPKNDRKVWAFIGDGEMDEPESTGAISFAAREKLNNLIFVINCNLQRLDGPVRGNGKIIQELERIFLGAGWNVIKVIWGSNWDKLLAKDSSGLLLKRMNECLDGDYQTFKARDGAYIRKHFFGKYNELLDLVSDMTDEEIWDLQRGGHDYQKVYNAYKLACDSVDKPTVILAKTVKGFGLGDAGEGKNITHQQKKMTFNQLKDFTIKFNLDINDDDIKNYAFYKPDSADESMKFIHESRTKLGGHFPVRKTVSSSIQVPSQESFQILLEDSDREFSTTMSFVRLLGIIMRDKNIKDRIVPIVADESRTFGMEGMFRQYGIYSPTGQNYIPEDVDKLQYYKEAKDGQVLQEGLNEAGAFASWMAVATSYQVNQYTMVPFYIYYSMFGFQRIADLIWAAADMRARGFLLGATSGRTTLAGEGLQHADGHSHIYASTVPNCKSYDPAFSYELTTIIQHGLFEMYKEEQDVFYYITLMNENYIHPPYKEEYKNGIIKGMYLLKNIKSKSNNAKVRLLGSGAILREVLSAADILTQEYDINCEVWSVTSFTELKREADNINRSNLLGKLQQNSYVKQCLPVGQGPVISATDYIRLYADQIRGEIEDPYYVLGTDGFGKSDTRDNLRDFFEVNKNYIVIYALKSLVNINKVSSKIFNHAVDKLNINIKKKSPF